MTPVIVNNNTKGNVMKKAFGLDVGTSNTILASLVNNSASYLTLRTAFLEVENLANTVQMLNRSKIPYVQLTGKDCLYIVGEHAIDLAGATGVVVRRPMASGILSPAEKESTNILTHIIQSLLKSLGEKGDGEKVCYSSPANPIDSDMNTNYHRKLIGAVIRNMGYDPFPLNEAHAMVYSELASNNFTGLCISFGAGMTNAVLAVNCMPVVTLSVAKGGDFIDKQSSQSRGTTTTRMQIIKEMGVDLVAPKNEDEMAIAFVYEDLIEYVIREFVKKFNASDTNTGNMIFKDKLPIVIAGGTSNAGNFIPLFQNTFANTVNKIGKFPFEVSNIVHSAEPINTIAKGLLLAAMESSI